MAANLPESRNITKEIIKKSIQRKEMQDDISVKHFSMSLGSERGDNFVCVIFGVEATTQQCQEEKQHKLIVKTTPNNEQLRKWILEESNVFNREVMMYKNVIPDMIEFQKQKGVEAVGPSVAQFYYSIVDKEAGTLVLEDLRADHYKMANRQAGLDYEHCKLVMKELGVFHALSWAMKKDNPTFLNNYPDICHDALFENGEQMTGLFALALTSAVNLLKACSDNEDIKLRAGKFLEMDLYTEIKKCIKPVEPYAVVCHADTWTANLFFKYENKGVTNPTKVKLLDFQISRYAPLTTDLAQFLFVSTTRETRQKHQTDLLRHYHTSFIECLKNMGEEFPEFTFEVLQQLFKESSLYGILFGLFQIPMVLASPDEAVQLDQKDTTAETEQYANDQIVRTLHTGENAVIIKERLIGIVEDAMDLNII